MSITFRPMTEKDLPFLERLYISTRWEEMQQAPWSDEQRTNFLKFQFNAQHDHYMKYFSDASFDIVLKKNKPIGRLYLDRRNDEIRIVDIALLPEYRGKGIGSQLLKDVMQEAQEKAILVRIHVEHNNPAMRLYERLEFKKIDEEGVYWLMEWHPTSLIQETTN